jgi:hypothetical protein
MRHLGLLVVSYILLFPHNPIKSFHFNILATHPIFIFCRLNYRSHFIIKLFSGSLHLIHFYICSIIYSNKLRFYTFSHFLSKPTTALWFDSILQMKYFYFLNWTKWYFIKIRFIVTILIIVTILFLSVIFFIHIQEYYLKIERTNLTNLYSLL